jgi:predicted membrane-bound spermidine synthase
VPPGAAGDPINSPQTPKGFFWAVSALFLLSGATGLAYETLWFKRFSHVWGNSTLAMAAVVASFLLGLGLGAYLLGKLADRVRVPLLWYGLCEATIGVLALIVSFVASAWVGACPSS